MDTTELNNLSQNFCKKIRAKKYTISALSEYLFDNKDMPNSILDNIKDLDKIINQSSYGDSKAGQNMIF